MGDDSLQFSVSQPNRVNNGEMSIKLSNLAESDGSISYRNKNINLKPTGRQLVYGFSYRKDYSKDTAFSLKHILIGDVNHIKSSNFANSSSIGVKYKDLKLGLSRNYLNSSIEANLEYEFFL